jgi:hypothetical protein
MDLLALWRFHVATGARIALRASVPLAGLFVIAIGMSPYPGATLARLAAVTAADRPPAVFVLVMTALAVSMAAWGVPRLVSGADGWIRSLPAGRTARRRGLAAGLATAAAPLAVVGGAVLVGAGVAQGTWNPARAAALIPLAFGAAYAVLPGRRFLAAPLGLAGAVVAISAGWREVGIGAVLVVAADLTAGGDASPGRRTQVRDSGRAAASWRIALRASRSGIPAAWAAAAIPLLAEALFIANNDLPASLESLGARLGVASAVVLCLATIADRLAVHRPPWPWARSLPWTSRERVSADAMFLGAVALPVLLAGGLIDPVSASLAAAALPLAATHAAGSIRSRRDGPAAISLAIIFPGLLGALAFALMPWLTFVALASTPVALRAAARREAALDVGRWRPLRSK